MQTQASPIVSFDDEPLILVDADDREIGYSSKAACHDGEGQLHRAFSVFLFNDHGEVLLQQRSADKRLWPLFWANSCCSHPRRGETMDAAAHRRTAEELSVTPALTFMYKFVYQASYGEAGSEHELCHVYVGHISGHVEVNHNEVAATLFMPPEVLDDELVSHASRYTPWLKLEWPRLRRGHWDAVERVLKAQTPAAAASQG